ncbi:unnamed protein product [Musa textilis]
MDANSILLYLRKLFEEHGRTQRYEISKSLFRARITERTPVQNHVLKMIEWIEKFTGLRMVLEDNLCVDIVLQSLSDSFSQFIMNFNMNKLEVTLPELLNMLREAESTIKKEKPVLYTGETRKKGKLRRPLRRARAKWVRQRLPRRTQQRTKASTSTAAKMGTGRGITKSTLQRGRNKS